MLEVQLDIGTLNVAVANSDIVNPWVHWETMKFLFEYCLLEIKDGNIIPLRARLSSTN